MFYRNILLCVTSGHSVQCFCCYAFPPEYSKENLHCRFSRLVLLKFWLASLVGFLTVRYCLIILDILPILC